MIIENENENTNTLNTDEFVSEELDSKTVYVNPGELYIVATPIGRIVDITLRAIKILEGVDLIAAEDTRRTYILLNILGIKKQVISNQKFNEHQKTEYFIKNLLDGKSIAVVSDAGTPCISDPGNELIKRCINKNIKVNPIPGCCAAITGLSASGFDLSTFTFRGFFPKENTEKANELKLYRTNTQKVYIYYESPKRIIKTIEFFVEENVACSICLCNDLTKNHERFYRGTPSEVFDELQNNPNAEKGEFTLIVELNDNAFPVDENNVLSAEAKIVDTMSKTGLSPKDAIEYILHEQNNEFRKNELKSASIRLKELFS